MKIKKFIIENYKGITTPIEINIDKNSLIPIIGINECGKTTILNAIYAFDFVNDDENRTFNHLNDIANLYSDTLVPSKVSAIVEVSKNELKKHIKSVTNDTDEILSDLLQNYSDDTTFDIKLIRIIDWQDQKLFSNYLIEPELSGKHHLQVNLIGKELIKNLPYILYFDDFRETFPDEIEISLNTKDNKWLKILEELFIKTNEHYSVYELKNLEDRRRKSILSQVKKKLNETLTKQWANFRIENKESLEIDIDFKMSKDKISVEFEEKQIDGTKKKVKVDQDVEKYFLKFDIIERDSKGNEHYFYVRDRSKGFYWFFNFVMKLEFNPNIAGDNNNAIYLLDEPGSYLHPYAQSKLCQKLKEISEKNIVIYCTHSHYLLNPDVIPLNKIHLASKSESKSITLDPLSKYKPKESYNLKTAFQTIYDALYIKPFDLDLNNKKILIVEGIYDYYAFSLFKKEAHFGILPGKGADSLVSFISLMIAFEIDFKVLWDNDSEGILGFNKAKLFFGEEMSERYFCLIPSDSGKKRILQDLFNGIDFKLIKNELELSENLSFERTIAALYFSKRKNQIIDKLSDETKSNFDKVFKLVGMTN